MRGQSDSLQAHPGGGSVTVSNVQRPTASPRSRLCSPIDVSIGRCKAACRNLRFSPRVRLCPLCHGLCFLPFEAVGSAPVEVHSPLPHREVLFTANGARPRAAGVPACVWPAADCLPPMSAWRPWSARLRFPPVGALGFKASFVDIARPWVLPLLAQPDHTVCKPPAPVPRHFPSLFWFPFGIACFVSCFRDSVLLFAGYLATALGFALGFPHAP